MNKDDHIVIIGAGISGLASAFYLKEKGYSNITVIEKESTVGGKACSIEYNGRQIDIGALVMILNSPHLKHINYVCGNTYNALSIPGIQLLDSSGVPIHQTMEPERVLVIESFLKEQFFSSVNIGFTGIENDLALPVADFCTKYNMDPHKEHYIKQMSFTLGMYGYGTIEEIPMMYGLKLMSCFDMATEQNVVYPHNTIANIARCLDQYLGCVEYNTEVLDICKENNSVVIEDDKGSRTADHVIVASPLHIPFSIYSDTHTSLFSKIQSQHLWTAVVKTSEDLAHGYAIPEFLETSKSNRLHGILLHSTSDKDIVHCAINGDDTLTKDQVKSIIRSDFSLYNIDIEEIVHVHQWDHFHHISMENIQDRWYDAFAALQGTDNVYFVHEVASFSLLEHCAEYAHHIIHSYF